MAAMRWSDENTDDLLEEALSRFLRDLTHRYGDADELCRSDRSSDQPAVSVEDIGSAYIVHAELPGVMQDGLKVTADAASVTLEGKWPARRHHGQGSIKLNELHTGNFKRVIDLPGPIQGDLIHAVLEGGILELEIPKASKGAASPCSVPLV